MASPKLNEHHDEHSRPQAKDALLTNKSRPYLQLMHDRLQSRKLLSSAHWLNYLPEEPYLQTMDRVSK